MPLFEFDARKSAANKAKHGIDFDQAQALWDDPNYVSRTARVVEEPRFQVIGRIGPTIWTATYTYRHEHTIRLISCRHARTEEQALYRAPEAEAPDDLG
jgi:uncharacterized DUF497 family protein